MPRPSLALLFASLILTAVAEASCRPSPDTKAFIELLYADAARATSAVAAAGGKQPFWGIFFDSECVHHAAAELGPPGPGARRVKTGIRAGAKTVELVSFAHGGSVELPSGGSIPPRVMTFAATYPPVSRPFVVMALPALWRAEKRHADDPRLDLLMRAVFAHEVTHTIHTPFVASRLDDVERRRPDVAIDDDIVQKTFEQVDAFKEAYERERDLLYAAVREADVSARSTLVRRAREVMAARRAKHYTGDSAIFAELEDTFLLMEGAANLAAFHLVRRTGASFTDAVQLIRRNGRFWSQDQGLAIFLLLDEHLPDWKRRVFTSEPSSVLELLREIEVQGLPR